MKRLCLIPLCLLAGAACAEVEVLQPGPGDAQDVYI